MNQTSSEQNNKKTNTIPATAITLTGQHLIEASAGTGKTWTLTGIVLRLLIEAKRPPEQIICTTFTRAAAAEMRERIMARLNEFFYLLQWLEKISEQANNHQWLYLADVPSTGEDKKQALDKQQIDKQQLAIFKHEREQQLIAHTMQTSHQISETLQDPVNLHLIHYLLDNFTTYPLAMAIRRTQLLLISMDKLFVGTLDSLAQKWLSEYSIETGYQKGMKISDNDDEKIADIVHDEIRKFHARTYHSNPTLYQLLQQSGKLTAVDDHLQSVNKAMQFISAPIDELAVVDFDFTDYQNLLNVLKQHDYSDVQPYFESAYCDSEGMAKRSPVATKIASVPSIFQAINEQGIGFFLHLDKEADSFLQNLPKAFIAYEDGGKVFKKANQSNRERFIELPTIRLLVQLVTLTDGLRGLLDNQLDQLNRQIALAVRHRLPIQLEENNQTTFSLQMVRLNQALAGRQGQKLARYIRHHYPVALIDESQDINGEQASMIGAIYLQKKSKANHNSANPNNDNQQDNKKKDKPTFLLLVGDPKQAIYGFRGGDVANYTAMKAQFAKNSQMTLTVNRRSNAKLINSLNHWFTEDNEPLKELGEEIYYHQIEAFKDTSRLSWHSDKASNDKDSNDKDSNDNNKQETPSILGKQAVAVIHACYAKKGEEQTVKGADKYEGLAKHIEYLLNSKQTIANEKGESRAITAQDIAILARSRKGLQQASWALEKLGIATVKTAETSVFSSQMATDLLAILQAIQHPFRTDFVNRALTTAWYGLTLQQVKSLEKANDKQVVQKQDSLDHISHHVDCHISYADFQLHLQKAEQLWSDYGVLSALQFLLADCLFADSLASSKSLFQTLPSGVEISTKKISVWEQLANGVDGERNLLDLRQLLELLTANTRGMTAMEVISWLALQRHKQPTDEDNKQQPIPTESGVQLMTIHKSKGLEFPIVYVLGMDSSAKENATGLAFFPYIQNGQRRLSPIKQDLKSELEKVMDYQQLVNMDNLSEAKRIAYVALTRASEQVYVVVRDHASKKELDYRPANIWLESTDKNYTLPNRLENYVDWIESADVIEATTETSAETATEESSETYSKRSSLQDTNDKTTQDTQNQQSQKIHYPNYDEVIKKKYFVGWRKTSFTALSRQLDKHSEDVAVAEADYLFEDTLADGIEDKFEDPFGEPFEEKGEQSNRIENNDFSENNIRFTFVRGAGAGTFLHQVFELMDFNNQQRWSEQIDKGLREYGLPAIYQSNHLLQQNSLIQENQPQQNTANATPHEELKSWLTDVLHSPLLASGKKLIDIPMQARKAEMGFDMGLGDGFRVERINEVLIKHLGADSDKLLTLNASDSNTINNGSQHYYRYLRGEIDLVYTDGMNGKQGKYYVVDYKSNHLGNHISDYSQANLAKAMSKAGYWLQALIYQVALHRFLRLRLADYRGNEGQYLGAVEYVFLRGCVADGCIANDSQYGKISWDIPIELVKEMDRVFG